MAIEPIFAALLARQDFEQPDIQPRGLVVREPQSPRHVQHAYRIIRVRVVSHHMPGADLHIVTCPRRTLVQPGPCVRPFPTARRANIETNVRRGSTNCNTGEEPDQNKQRWETHRTVLDCAADADIHGPFLAHVIPRV